MDLSIGIVIGALFLIVVAVSLSKRRSALRERDSRISGRDELYRKLLARLLGDEPTANRLIQYERQRTPRADEAELIRAAIERLEYDRKY